MLKLGHVPVCVANGQLLFDQPVGPLAAEPLDELANLRDITPVRAILTFRSARQVRPVLPRLQTIGFCPRPGIPHGGDCLPSSHR